MSENPTDENMRDLLQSVETDTARTSSNRDQVRRSVLAAFDDAIVAKPEMNDAEVIPIVSLDSEARRSISSPRAISWMAVAAAVLIVTLAVSGARWRISTTGPANPGTSEELRLSSDARELPAPLLPGRQTTRGIAGGLSFDAPDGLAVIAEGNGHLVLAVADEQRGSIGQLIIVETELSDWEAELAALADAGEVNIKQIGVMVAGRATTRLDVTVTNKAMAARSCAGGEPCIGLDGWPSTGPVALWAGADNRIVEIGRTDDKLVLAIEQTQRSADPLSPLATQVVTSATLSSD